MKSFRIIVLAVIAAAGVATLQNCGSRHSDTRPVLVVSVEPQRQILEQLAGDKFRIVTMLPNGENPETFDPSPARRVDIENAKAYFSTGQLAFEKNLRMTSKNPSAFVDTSRGINLIYGTHCSHDDHSSFLGSDNHAQHSHANVADPHVWASVKNARIVAEAMTRKLIEIDPDNTSIYKENLKAYQHHVDSLDQAFTATISGIENPAFMVWHPSLTYFARDYGIEQVAMTDNSKEATPKSLGNILDKAKDSDVRIFVYQPLVDNREAEMIYTGIGIDTISYNGLAYDWESQLSKVINVIARK